MARYSSSMSAGLTIAGGLFELVGLGFVFAELVRIRSREFDIAPPWVPLVARIRRIGRRRREAPKPATTPANITGMHASARLNATMDLTIAPSLAPREAPLPRRVTAIEDYVQWGATQQQAANRAIRDAHQATLDAANQRAAQAEAEIDRRADAVEAEVARREAERKAQLRASLRPQAIGASCVLIGLVLGTIGNLA